MKAHATTRKTPHAGLVPGLLLFVCAVAWTQTAEWTVYNTTNSPLPYNGITALALEAEGTLWVGTGRWYAFAGGGLARFDGANWTVYNTANSPLPGNDHISLTIDADGNIWSRTETGLSKFDGENWTVYLTTNSGLPDNQTGAPVFDIEGNGWIPTGNGLVKFDGENWTVYTTGNSGLPSNFIWPVAFDAQGDLWVGTFGSGLARFDGADWTVYRTGNCGLPENTVVSLATDAQQNVWIGTYGGVAKFDGLSWSTWTSSDSRLPNNRIWNLAVDPTGGVWAGTDAGLARLNGHDWTVYRRSNSGLPDDVIYSLAIEPEGRVWIGTANGGLVAFCPRPILDFSGNGLVDIDDLLRLIESWGQDDPVCDIGPTVFGDGLIDRADLEVMMSYWGQEVPDSTLAGHWRLDETEGVVVTDSAGDHDGTVIGNPAWQPAAGVVDGALAFDGATYVATDSVLNPTDEPFSVLAWVQGGAPGQAIVSQVDGAGWLTIDTSLGTLATELVPPPRRVAVRPLVSNAVIADGLWHRVAFVWDGLNRSLYLDGTLVAQDEQESLAGCRGGLNIGCDKDMTPSTFWNGLIDDVRIYSRAVRP